MTVRRQSVPLHSLPGTIDNKMQEAVAFVQRGEQSVGSPLKNIEFKLVPETDDPALTGLYHVIVEYDDPDPSHEDLLLDFIEELGHDHNQIIYELSLDDLVATLVDEVDADVPAMLATAEGRFYLKGIVDFCVARGNVEIYDWKETLGCQITDKFPDIPTLHDKDDGNIVLEPA